MGIMSFLCSWYFLGASACVKLTLFEKAITWCDEGLAVSFDCIFMAEGAKTLHCKTIMVAGRVEGCKDKLLV